MLVSRSDILTISGTPSHPDEMKRSNGENGPQPKHEEYKPTNQEKKREKEQV